MPVQATELFLFEHDASPDAESAASPFAVRLRPGCRVTLVDGGLSVVREHLGATLRRAFDAPLSPDIEPMLDQALREALQEGQARVTVRATDGHTRLAQLSPLLDPSGTALGIALTHAREGGEGGESADAARRAAAAPPDTLPSGPPANEMGDPRTHFLGVLSHELRTPLAAMQGWTDVLRHALPEHDKQTDAARVRLARRALAGLDDGLATHIGQIDRLLDAASVLSGHIELDAVRFDLGEAAHAAVAACEPMLAARAQSVRCTLDCRDGACEVVGDPARIGDVLGALLVNASQCSAHGADIDLRVRRHTEGGREAVEVVIADAGIGFPPAVVDRLFEPFMHAESVYARANDGLGLGLAVARRLVELHGGHIAARSRGAGQGAEFLLRLPARPGAAELAGQALDGITVLLVEADPGVREAIDAALCTRGATVYAVPAGQAALSLLDAGLHPHLVVCDAHVALPSGGMTRQSLAQHATPGEAQHRVPGLTISRYVEGAPAAADYSVRFARPVDPDSVLHAVAALARV